MKSVYVSLISVAALLASPVLAAARRPPGGRPAPGTGGYLALHGGANVYQSFETAFPLGELRSISITTLAGMVESSSATFSGHARIASP